MAVIIARERWNQLVSIVSPKHQPEDIGAQTDSSGLHALFGPICCFGAFTNDKPRDSAGNRVSLPVRWKDYNEH